MTKFEYVELEMENLRHKKNTCEEKNIFFQNGIGKCI